MNNYERIKQMSVKEMVEFIKNGTYDCNCCPANPITEKCFGCKKQIKQWLLKECE